jgi:hypothetical protein
MRVLAIERPSAAIAHHANLERDGCTDGALAVLARPKIDTMTPKVSAHTERDAQRENETNA